MKYFHKNYLTKLLGFTEKLEGKNTSFKDAELQNKFSEFKFKKQSSKSSSMTFFICFPMFILALFTIYTNKKPIRPTYFFSGGILLDIILSFVFQKFENSYLRLKWFRYIRFFIFYFNISINWIFAVNPIDENVFRYAYTAVFYIIFLQNYFLNFNYFVIILITILNSVILFVVQLTRNLGYYYLLPEIVVNIIYYYIFNLLKKSEIIYERNSFFESFKNNHYIEYIQTLVNVLNTMIISIKNEEVLFINDFALNYFTKNASLISPKITCSFNIEDNKENEILMNNKNSENQLNRTINNFFNSLVLNTSSDDKYKTEENFRDIIDRICCENTSYSVNFIKIGYFTSKYNKNLCYEIHARQLKYQDEALEILICDNSEIKQAEVQAFETKYKHKILTKIAHEFKTPLITIISLINKIMKDGQHFSINDQIKKRLYYIHNLSNYTLSLISDIIQYVSEYINLRINKEEINLMEVMEFSNNVLKTLVECNEYKADKIETKLKVDPNLERIKIFTDENRLKQIILNLISNAFKFTQYGSIKLKAKYIYRLNVVEISIKDSGIGIKEEDHHLIFRENIQLNVENEYNSQGSGLGLSIVKNLADALNYKIGFESTYGKGSKFFIRIDCLNHITRNHNKTFNLNYDISLLENLAIDNEVTTKESKSNFKRSTRNVLCFIDSEDKRIQRLEMYNNTDLVETEKIDFHPSKFKEPFSFLNNIHLETSKFDFTIFSSKQINTNLIKLVIVDDHKLVREFTLNLLISLLKDFNSQSYDIVECSDGIELLNLVRLDAGNQIKLILNDENMEYLNGSESVKIIRILEENKKIKYHHIVSITAFDDQQTKERILNSGVNSIITKPCTKSDLSKLLSNYFIPLIKN